MPFHAKGWISAEPVENRFCCSPRELAIMLLPL